MSVVTFFKKIITSSIKRMVKGVEKEIRTDGKASFALVATVVFIMKEMKMVKGMKLLELLIHGLFAEKGKNMPEDIAELFGVSAVIAPALKPAVTTVVAKPAVVLQTPAKPVPATEPARELRMEKTPEQNKEELMKFLTSFVEGGEINPKKTLFKIASVAKTGVALNREEWGIFFRALLRADEISLENPMFHIIDGKCDPTKFFMLAPPDMLLAYLCSKEGLILKIKVFFSEIQEGQKIEGYLLAKVALLLDLVWVAKQTAKLTEKEEGKLAWLVPALQKNGAPEGLIDDAYGMMRMERVCEKTRKGDGPMAKALDAIVGGEGPTTKAPPSILSSTPPLSKAVSKTVEKPETLGPEADAQFARQMLAAAGEAPNIAQMSEEDLKRATAPTMAIN